MKFNVKLVSFVLGEIYPEDIVVNVETCRENDYFKLILELVL
jgi:hypothetical protein